MIKKIFAFVTFLFMMNFTITFAAQSIIDTQNLLTPDEIKSLTQKIQQVEQKHNVKIGIEFLKNTHGQNVENTANSLLDKNFSGAPNGGILLLVVMDTRKWYISTDYEMSQRIPDTSALSNAFLSKLSAGDYYGACNSYIDGVDKSLSYYEENGTATGFDPLAGMLAFVLAIICAGFFRSALIGSMSNVHPAVSAADYLKRDTVKITDRRDNFLFTKVSRRRKSKGSSSSGSGGHSGGGSHGGGGGSF